MEIDDFKNIWKEQKAEKVNFSGKNYTDLTASLVELERKSKRRFVIISIGQAFAFTVVAWVMLSNSFNSPLTYVGYILVLFTIIAIVITYWTTAINVKPEKLSHPSLEFLKEVVDKFYRRKFIRVYLFPVYITFLMTGITLPYVELLSQVSLERKIVEYGIVYIFLIGISIWKMRKEIRREKKVVDPVRDRISNIISQMEAQD